ncbi:MAG: hypothetical protein J1F67_02915 [Muribaculaceae bacterium]|nr:hypothetical protein [Muribaculaceae bacterium]
MKKSLLLTMALLGGMCAYAQAPTGGTDVTPAGYKFGEVKQIPWYDNGFGANGYGFTSAANFTTSSRAGKGVWTVLGSSAQEYWDANNGLMGCAWVADEEMMNQILEGCQLVDLGGEVGQVFCWQGRYSNLKEQLQENYPNENWDNIPDPIDTNVKQGWNFNVWLNPNQVWTKGMGFYRFRMVMNALHNVPEDLIDESDSSTLPFRGQAIFKEMYQVNNQGNNTSFIYTGEVNEEGEKVNTSIRDGWDNGSVMTPITNDLFVKRFEDGAVMENDYGDPMWDPTKWIVVDYYFNVAGNDKGVDENGDATTPVRIKFNTDVFMNYHAVLIKEFSVTQFDGELTQDIYDLNKLSYPELTLTPGVAGVQGIIDDYNAPVEYYNLQGMKVANPEKGIFIKKQGKKSTKVVL